MTIDPESILGAGGVFERAVPDFSARPSQMAMAKSVMRVFSNGGFLLAEAGTGTGKTLAYLVPAVLSGKRTVVSTATRHLQEQTAAAARLLIDLLDPPASGKVTVLKGRSNYACRRKLMSIPMIGADVKAAAIHRWSLVTRDGDRAGCDGVPEDDPCWGDVAADFEDCLSFRCPLRSECFVERAKEEARRSRIAVVNHHLLFSDLSGSGESRLLPEMDTVILDEAHAVPQIAAQCLGARLDAPAVSAAVSKAARACGAGGRGFRDVKKTVSAIEGLARAFFGTFTGGGGAPRVRYDRFSLPDGAVEAHIGLDGALAGLCGALEKAGRKEGAPPEIALAGLGIERIRAVLADLVEARDGSFVYYSEPAPRGVLLAAEPVEPGEILRERFYPMLGTAVFTSATLSAGGGLGYSAARLGLDGLGCEALEFASPFDYTAQAALYLPKAIPDPNSPGFTGAAIAEIDALTRITGGRAFVLCTSRRQMEAYHAALRDGLPYSVLIQGEIPKREILERFRKGGPCVLFATSSFWEGVDVPGEALSLVIIDRIPFDPPGDPVNEARAELARSRGHDPFRSFQLPEAALALKQGFGRLIRTVTDRGIAAILDPRIKTRSYGRYLLKTLPAMNTFDDTGDLKAWWEKTRG